MNAPEQTEPQTKLMTAEEFAAMPADGRKYELVRGRLVEVCRPKFLHGALQMRIADFIQAYLFQNPIGRGTTESGYKTATDPDSVLGPDVAFVSNERLGQADPFGYVSGGPDLVVEIVSPGDTAQDLNDKIAEYFAAGTRLIWVVYPKAKMVYVYSGPTEVTIQTQEGTLDGGAVLPGFSLPLAEVFKGLDAPPTKSESEGHA